MANPFERRATEYLRDDEAGFLSLVSPEPLKTYFRTDANRGQLYNLLVRVIGTPGSGKTTMATLLEARMVDAVLAEREKEDHGEIIKALVACGVIDRGHQRVAGVRLPMEGEYRDFWELPYDDSLKTKLVLALIQSRAVLGLARNLERRRGRIAVEFIPRSDAGAALEEIGGAHTQQILERARAVERAVYQVGASLVPFPEDRIPDAAVRPFRPFDVIEGIRIVELDGTKLVLKPLIILDDAHTLAPRQFALMFRDLARREIRVARWIMMRLDALPPSSALGEGDSELAPELKSGRDYIDIFLQRSEDRYKSRTVFRSMARSMADRYLRRHPVFDRRQYRGFETLLSSEPDNLPEQAIARIKDDVSRLQKRLRIASTRRNLLQKEVDRYVQGSQSRDVGPEVQLAMLSILMHRYAKRVPQQSLFSGDENPDPRQVVVADAGVADAARLHLRHSHNRAFHYGLNTISDASSENAELFLHLSAALVDRMEARIINGDPPLLIARQQDKILGDRARQIIEKWNFPFAPNIRNLLESMARECLEESLKPNAPLDAGANAVGIPQDEFEAIRAGEPELVQLLHFAIAYNALILRPNYRQGGHDKRWCLFELGGPAILADSLTLKRGGFLERRTVDLLRYAGLRQ
jgi:hypothetical protein